MDSQSSGGSVGILEAIRTGRDCELSRDMNQTGQVAINFFKTFFRILAFI